MADGTRELDLIHGVAFQKILGDAIGNVGAAVGKSRTGAVFDRVAAERGAGDGACSSGEEDAAVVVFDQVVLDVDRAGAAGAAVVVDRFAADVVADRVVGDLGRAATADRDAGAG